MPDTGKLYQGFIDTQVARIEALADKWLEPLGLKWWRKIWFNYSTNREEFGAGNDEAIMRVTTDWRYMEAVVDINLLYVAEEDDADLEHDFLHEMVHILLDEISNKEQEDHVERVTTQVARAFQWVRDFAVDGKLEKVEDNA